ncbi:hypothetical protein LguiA_025936 [Lonicera macranthoides]
MPDCPIEPSIDHHNWPIGLQEYHKIITESDLQSNDNIVPTNNSHKLAQQSYRIAWPIGPRIHQ